jgi:hypothetical protein
MTPRKSIELTANGTYLSKSSSGILPLGSVNKRLEARFYRQKAALPFIARRGLPQDWRSRSGAQGI